MAEISNLWRVVQSWLDEVPFPPSQAKLGKAIGVSRSTISEWKYGTATPTPAHMRRLSELMAPHYGPTVFADLIRAMNADGGYLVPEAEAAVRVVHEAERRRRRTAETRKHAQKEDDETTG